MQLDLPLLKAIRPDVAIVSHRPAYAALQLFHSPSDSYPVQAHETVPLDDETVKVLESLDSSSFFFLLLLLLPRLLVGAFSLARRFRRRSWHIRALAHLPAFRLVSLSSKLNLNEPDMLIADDPEDAAIAVYIRARRAEVSAIPGPGISSTYSRTKLSARNSP